MNYDQVLATDDDIHILCKLDNIRYVSVYNQFEYSGKNHTCKKITLVNDLSDIGDVSQHFTIERGKVYVVHDFYGHKVNQPGYPTKLWTLKLTTIDDREFIREKKLESLF